MIAHLGLNPPTSTAMIQSHSLQGLAAASLLDASHPVATYTGGWSEWGGSYLNSRWALSTKISSTTIPSLREHCKLTYPVGVSALPAVLNGVAHYPTWNGSVVALDYKQCSVKWMINATSIIETFRPFTSLQNHSPDRQK